MWSSPEPSSASRGVELLAQHGDRRVQLIVPQVRCGTEAEDVAPRIHEHTSVTKCLRHSRCAWHPEREKASAAVVGHRRQGLAGELLTGAIDFARTEGAAVLEACAVDTAQAGKISAADLYRGPLSVYLDADFKELSRTSPRWVLVSKSLR